MGILRVLLAIVVVISHSPITNIPKPLGGNGGLAVCAFFIISGFYMSLIVEKYQLHILSISSLKNFYFSRFLRIFPIYYLCLLLTLILYTLHAIPLVHSPLSVLHSLGNLSDKIKYISENIFLFGQDWMRFFIYDDKTKSFLFHPQTIDVAGDALGSSFAILGQAWSLSLELTFYLLVPFILTKSTRFIFLICLASFILRITLTYINSHSTLASDVFFPLALGIFLLGALSHRIIYSKINNVYSKKNKLTAFVLITCTSLVCLFTNPNPSAPVNLKFLLTWWSFLFLVTLTIPYLFLLTKKSKLDQYIGELSYPIYMTHFFCIGIITKFSTSMYVPYFAIAVSTTVSILITFLIARPLDYFRHTKFLQPNSQTSTWTTGLTEKGILRVESI